MKKQTMVTIDDDLIARAKELRINLSGTINHLLKEYLAISKNNLPEKNLIVICSKCGKQIEQGYYCWESKTVWCDECQEKNNHNKLPCPFDRFDMHAHIRWKSNSEIPGKILEDEAR